MGFERMALWWWWWWWCKNAHRREVKGRQKLDFSMKGRRQKEKIENGILFWMDFGIQTKYWFLGKLRVI